MSKIMTMSTIQSQIFTTRNMQVILDSDLSEMYQVETRILNQAIKRNNERFPENFIFQLTADEWENLRSQNVTSSWGGRRKPPYVFTDQGVSMLSGILKSATAIKVNITIMRTFMEMRKFITNNASIFQRLDRVEQKQLITDQKFEQIFKAIEDKSIKPKQGIFFDGQIFDAYTFVADLIKQAKQSIIVIDNYVDESVITMLTKRGKNADATIYTKPNKQLELDVKKHNQQYSKILTKTLTKSHDRFIILDKKEVYHFGASLKDLGKKWFAFSKMEIDPKILLRQLDDN